MAVNHTVRAAVVDIRQDAPKQEDVFLIDTNVWYWLAYGASVTAMLYQTKDYPAFIKKAIMPLFPASKFSPPITT